MAWVPVAFLYLLVGLGLLGLFFAPVQTVWRAFWVRPLLRKYARMKGERGTLPKGVQNSPQFAKAKRDEELLHTARNRGMISLSLLFVVLEGRVALQGYKWPGFPGDLGAVNKLLGGIFAHLAGTFERVGVVWAVAGIVIAIVLGFLAINLLDLLGDALGIPLRKFRDGREEAAKRKALKLEQARKASQEASAGPVIEVVNYYAELDVPTTARPEAIAGTLAGIEAQWNRRLAKGDEAVQARARQYLELIAEAREILLDPDKRIDYDRKIGLRAAGGPDGGKKKANLVDSRKVDGEALRQIEEMKQKRKAQKAQDTNIPEKP